MFILHSETFEFDISPAARSDWKFPMRQTRALPTHPTAKTLKSSFSALSLQLLFSSSDYHKNKLIAES
jgi:hypothetical protein